MNVYSHLFFCICAGRICVSSRLDNHCLLFRTRIVSVLVLQRYSYSYSIVYRSGYLISYSPSSPVPIISMFLYHVHVLSHCLVYAIVYYPIPMLVCTLSMGVNLVVRAHIRVWSLDALRY
ncbi:hypothetical protein HOT81_gp124 [Gordonia phage Fryberger]|uniref:Uncharacterized protein n=1 Tax=Gordonia phage Fryberger TaxID=2250392 RepID=A0A346FCU4_9CAUD|nr:hypothetical protein HOT81_gp124 [Gordonia phage Fryberger]AXN53558.1 hypothetical protein SEA_FRYBERGER_146 [Gordonia phage Fryberger]